MNKLKLDVGDTYTGDWSEKGDWDAYTGEEK